jgi:DNA-binding response OmpR family regulator
MSNPKIILIVDDEPDLIEIAQTYLEEAGYKVISAADGLEGLQTAKSMKPNLILLDIAMPGIDGLEMLQILRGTPGLAAIPVIMLTARGRTDNIFEADRLHAVDFLIKPFAPEDLLSIVRKVI